jgi:hypothetical protein
MHSEGYDWDQSSQRPFAYLYPRDTARDHWWLILQDITMDERVIATGSKAGCQAAGRLLDVIIVQEYSVVQNLNSGLL